MVKEEDKVVKRRKTVWIPEEMDIALRIICAKDNKGFSEVSEEAYKLYLAKKKSKLG
jgi:hypothetical protein